MPKPLRHGGNYTNVPQRKGRIRGVERSDERGGNMGGGGGGRLRLERGV